MSSSPEKKSTIAEQFRFSEVFPKKDVDTLGEEKFEKFLTARSVFIDSIGKGEMNYDIINELMLTSGKCINEAGEKHNNVEELAYEMMTILVFLNEKRRDILEMIVYGKDMFKTSYENKTLTENNFTFESSDPEVVSVESNGPNGAIKILKTGFVIVKGIYTDDEGKKCSVSNLIEINTTTEGLKVSSIFSNGSLPNVTGTVGNLKETKIKIGDVLSLNGEVYIENNKKIFNEIAMELVHYEGIRDHIIDRKDRIFNLMEAMVRAA